MDNTQIDQNEEQKLQQAQNVNSSSGTASAGQTNLSADYSAVDSGQQDDVVASDRGASNDEGQSVVSTVQPESNDQNTQGIEQESTEENENEGSLMNDFSEEHIDDEIDSDGEEEVDTEDEEETEETEEVEEPATTDETTGEQAENGVVVGDGGNLAEVPNESSAEGDGNEGLGSATETDPGLSGEVPAPDLTPETDTTPVEEVIDGAFADFNSGNADAGDVLSGGAEE